MLLIFVTMLFIFCKKIMWEDGHRTTTPADRIREEIERIGKEAEEIRRAINKRQGDDRNDSTKPQRIKSSVGEKKKEE
jgi:hypothetical protein